MREATLSKPWHGWLLSLHVAASVGVLGADLGVLVLGVAGLGGAAPTTVYPAARLIVQWLVAPLALAALGTGVTLALTGSWGLFRHAWVAIKLAITVALTGAVLFVLIPALAATADAVTTQPAAALEPRARVPLAVAPAVASTLLLTAVALAVFKPRRALPKRKPPSTGSKSGVRTTR